MTPMRHIMLDLETLGTKPGSVILSIGAVLFDPKTGELGEEFYTAVSSDSCVGYGLTVDQKTAAWWDKQSDEARVALRAALDPEAPKLHEALAAFKQWVQEHSIEKNNRLIWGNGASFDVPLLDAAYEAVRLVPPYEFWGSMCFRTMKNLHRDVVAPAREGTHHNALDDAKHQARHLIAIMKEHP